MKKYLTLLILLCAVAYAEEPNINVEWDAPTNNVDGSAITESLSYRMYSGSASRTYTTNWLVNTNRCQLLVPLSTTRYFSVTAVNAFGDQSDYSNELMIQRVKPKPPVVEKYTITTVK